MTQNVYDRRDTGGSRPGTGKQYAEQLGGGAKINLLTTVDWMNSGGGAALYSGNFDDTVLWTQDSDIAAASWVGSIPASITQVFTAFSTAASQSISAVTKGAAYSAVTISTSSAYSIQVGVNFLGYLLSGASGTVRIYARMDASAPTPASGMYAELTMARSGDTYTYSGALYVDNVSVQSFTGGTDTSPSGVFKVTISTNTVTATWRDNALLGSGTVISSHGANTRVGLSATASAFTSTARGQYNNVFLSNFSINTASSANTAVRTTICAASNGQLYYDNVGTMTAVGSAVLDAVEILQGVDYQQKLYIANWSGSDAGMVPKIYDPAAGTVSTWTATDGTLPARCSLICRYQDRLVLARPWTTPHLWFMSRKGDPLDWDYTELADGDNGSAISGQNSDASAIGSPITALIPWGDDYLVMGCETELWVMRGDPAFGGQIDNLSRKIGMLGQFAHAKTPEGGIIFLSADGLYYLAPGATSIPESISREKIPNELLNMHQTGLAVKMEYDTEFRGAWIFVRNPNGGQNISYFFDWENKAFWPMQYPATQEATQALFVNQPGYQGVLMGGEDGYLRRHSVMFTSDDGTALGSYVEIGPIRIGGSDYDEGKLTEMIGTPHAQLGSIAWTVKAATNAQALFNAASGAVSTITGTWTTGSEGSGLNAKDRQRIRGGACVIRLEEVSGAPWAIESIQAAIQVAGKQRVA